jgi:putative transposase
MSRKRTTYSIELKTKLVLELLQGDKTLNEIASANNITPKNLQNWKAIFLSNAEMAMEPSRVVKEYKEEIKSKDDEIEELQKQLGKSVVEKEWLTKKLKSSDLSDKKRMIDSEHKVVSIAKQCELLGLNRSSLYYTPIANSKKEDILLKISDVFEQYPIYGGLKVHQQLLEEGVFVSPNTVFKYRKELGLQAVLAVKPIHTTQPNKEHKKYSYKLRGLDITHANQVWSTDITYIKINGGMVYMAAIIDWYSKAVLSWRISNTMDTALVMSVLDEALLKYGKPEIFNTDQGSQYTSFIHTQKLKDNGVIISMDGKGRATDNIAIERFWRSAKCERIYLNEYFTIKQLKEDVMDYMHFYNYKRFHQTLKYKKPMQVYFDSLQANDEEYANHLKVEA